MQFARKPWGLTPAVLDVAGLAARSDDPDLARAGREASVRLAQPLCIAVVGRVSSGKFTLLNALLGASLRERHARALDKIAREWDAAELGLGLHAADELIYVAESDDRPGPRPSATETWSFTPGNSPIRRRRPNRRPRRNRTPGARARIAVAGRLGQLRREQRAALLCPARAGERRELPVGRPAVQHPALRRGRGLSLRRRCHCDLDTPGQSGYIYWDRDDSPVCAELWGPASQLYGTIQTTWKDTA